MKKFFAMLWNLVLPPWVFGFLLILALASFDLFNFAVTEYSLKDMLGDLRIFDILWATIFAVAFCCIDFFAVAHLFTTIKNRSDLVTASFILGIWFIASFFNAVLVWWGIFLKTQNLTVSLILAILIYIVRLLIASIFVIVGNKTFTVKPISLALMFEK